jgi:hypothetical protein
MLPGVIGPVRLLRRFGAGCLTAFAAVKTYRYGAVWLYGYFAGFYKSAKVLSFKSKDT